MIALRRSRQRVRCFQQIAQFVGDDVGVDLRRRDVGVAEQELHGAQVGAA